jgi:sulfatase maturation enzyme AslB (radical SAM superfamily)
MASGRGTFQRVLDNLIECLDHGMDIDLLTVCDDENIGMKRS